MIGKIKTLIKVSITALLVTSVVPSATAKIPDSIKTILKGSEFRNVTVSPTGKYLSLVMKQDDRGTLIFLDRKTGKPVGQSIRYEEDDGIGVSGGSWVAPGLFKYRVTRDSPAGRRPQDWGDQFLVNVETGKNTRIWTYEGVKTNKILGGKRVYGSMDILSYLPDDDNNMLVAIYPWQGRTSRPEIYKFEFSTSDLTRVMTGPALGASLAVNSDANTYVAEAPSATDLSSSFYYRREGDKEWTDLDIEVRGDFTILNLSDDGNSLYGLGQQQEGPNAPQELIKISLTTGSVEVVHEFGFVSSIEVSFAEGGHPGYATWVADKPELKIFQKDKQASLVAGFMKGFAGYNVSLTSVDKEEENMVFHVSSPGIVGEYYIWEKASGQARYLFSSNEEIDKLQLNPYESVVYEASDGVKIQGWLVMPRSGKPKALINYIHGGPHGPYNGHWFDSYVQIYAELGYAVFAPNFRGSGGYGKNFERAGYTLWGTRMLDDMREGAEYVQANYDVGDKVYTAGGSYGGYSSAQNVVRHNDYYDCSIIDAGFFEFEELKDTWDGRRGFYTDAYTNTAMGTDTEELISQSPIHNLNRVQVPMIVSHGKVDYRTPVAGARKFHAALKKTDIDFEYYEYSREGHGLYWPKNRYKHYGRVQKFLDRCDAMDLRASK